MTRTGQISRWSSIKRNLISAVPRRSPQPFLKCRAPSAADRSRDEAGKSPPPSPGRNAGPTPESGAAPTPPPALRFHCASCAASRVKYPARLRSGSTADRCSQQGDRFPLELIRKMTPSLAHSTPFRSRRSLAKVSTNSREAQSPSRVERSSFAYRCSGPVGKARRSERAQVPEKRLDHPWPRHRCKAPEDEVPPKIGRRQDAGDGPSDQYRPVAQSHLR